MSITSIVQVLIPPLPDALTYSVPDELDQNLSVGQAVEIPLGKRWTTGYIVAKESKTDEELKKLPFALKDIKKPKRHFKLFSHSQIPLFEWIANYYGQPLSSVFDAAIPEAPPASFDELLKLTASPPEGLKGVKIHRLLELLEDAPQHEILLSEVKRHIKGVASAVTKLESLGILNRKRVENFESHRINSVIADWAKPTVELNVEQTIAVNAVLPSIEKQEFKPFLLQGVTGSGKTEVYFELMRAAVAMGRTALLIVPEIALTPQLLERIRARLGGVDIAVLHSAIHPRARFDGWRALLEGRANVGIGVRSGVFAPLSNIGVIIVDEEHDQSYKQESHLRYQARDVAVMRAKFENCPVVLGSATPSLESYSNAKSGKYGLLTMFSRPSAKPLPTIEIIDLKKVPIKKMISPSISPALHLAIQENLSRHEQIFILYNRRGFAMFLQCECCGEVVRCPHCSVTLVLHKSKNSLQCHYCGHQTNPPKYCGPCDAAGRKPKRDVGEENLPTAARFLPRGTGTEGVYEELQKLFPQAKLGRLDRDSVSSIDDIRKVLDSVRSGDVEILIGTQMIAKGHDLPGVTLVGVINCDVGLHMPDFRASERVFQLLTQVSGRAGRGDKPGKVLLQTFASKHPALECVSKNLINPFLDYELTLRKETMYPPYTRLLRILVQAPDADEATRFAEYCAKFLMHYKKQTNAQFNLIGPVAPPLERLRGLWRMHTLLRALDSRALIAAQQALTKNVSVPKNVRLLLDMDPYELL